MQNESTNRLGDKIESKTEKFMESSNKELKEMIESQNKYLNSSSEKIDREILAMNTKFKELAGTQLRRPNLICRYNGNNLENSTIYCNRNSMAFNIELKNIGDGAAKNISARLYIKSDQYLSVNYSIGKYRLWFDSGR